MVGLPLPRKGARPDDAGIRDEILALNLRRIFRLALILAPVHLAHIVLFWRHTATADPASESWRRGIIAAHALMLPVAVALAILCRAAGRAGRPARLQTLIPGVTTLIYLGFGVALAVIDQQVNSSITPLLLATVGVASALLIPPLTAAALFTGLLASFWFLAAWTQTDPEILLSLRVNAISMAGVGFGIAYLLWRNQVLTLRQRNEIETQKLALEKKNEELALLANRDPLTGVANRFHLTSAAAVEAARMKRNSSTASLVLLDLDRFKAINDNFGHPVGDAVLRQVAEVLTAEVRNIDTLTRLGGEEFAILLPDTPPAAAAEVAERLRAAIEAHPFSIGGTALELTASLGVAPLAGEGSDPFNTAYRAADRMLYLAKERGRNRVCVAELTRAGE